MVIKLCVARNTPGTIYLKMCSVECFYFGIKSVSAADVAVNPVENPKGLCKRVCFLPKCLWSVSRLQNVDTAVYSVSLLIFVVSDLVSSSLLSFAITPLVLTCVIKLLCSQLLWLIFLEISFCTQFDLFSAQKGVKETETTYYLSLIVLQSTSQLLQYVLLSG